MNKPQRLSFSMVQAAAEHPITDGKKSVSHSSSYLHVVNGGNGSNAGESCSDAPVVFNG